MVMKSGIFAVLAAFALVFAMQAAGVQAATSIAASPSSITVNEGSSFSVDFDMNTDESVFSASFFVHFDNNILNATSVTEGTFLNGGDPDNTYSVIDIDNDNGLVKFYCTRLGDIGGVTGSGTLASIAFDTLSNGDSDLGITDVEVYDPNIDTITTSVTNGTVSVNGVPVMDAISDKNVNEGQTLSFAVSGSDPDGDPLTYTVTSGPGSMSGSTYTYSPGWDTNHDDESYSVTIEADDGRGGTDTETFQVNVNDVNRDPSIDSYTPASTTPSVSEGSSLDFSVSASDPESDTLSYSWTLDGTEVSTSSSYTYSPGYSDAGTHTVIATVSDGYGGTASQTWTVTVTESNRAPEITWFFPSAGSISLYTGYVMNKKENHNNSQLFNHTSTDPDGDTLTYSWKLNGIEKSTAASWMFSTAGEQCGTSTMELEVSDSQLTDTQSWTVSIFLDGDANGDNTVDIEDLTIRGDALRAGTGIFSDFVATGRNYGFSC